MNFDLVIRNGTVVDGSGRPRYRADVGIQGDRIAFIGRIRERGAQEIDAEGKFVAPGFIEVHSHMDAQVFWDPLGTCPSWHGVTSTIMGNCGFTLAPCRASEADLVFRSIERAEDIARKTMLAGIEWKWETFAQYLDVVDALPKNINYAGYIGHSALRTYVMGERAFEQKASVAEVEAMTRELESALKAGAIGFSTSRTDSHSTYDDKPVPSRVAEWSEIRTLVNAMGALGAGLFEITTENFGTPESRRPFQDALQALALESGRPVTFITVNVPWHGDAWKEMLALTERTVAQGGRMVSQVQCRAVQSILGFKVRLPFDQLPTWKTLRSQPLEAQKAGLLDPALRARLVAEAMNGPYGSNSRGVEARTPDWDALCLFDSPIGPYRSLASLAAERGVTPADVMIDAALATNLEQFFVQPIANCDMRDVEKLLMHPNSVVGGSDSGAHVSQIIDSSMPTFLLAYWVREKGVLSWEQAVRKLTFDSALAWQLQHRGLVAPGNVADLVVFDPETVAPAMPEAAHDLPANGLRLKQRATGIAATIVAGQVILRDGEHTGAMPGRVLRGPLAEAR